jgi:hypothetical protein
MTTVAGPDDAARAASREVCVALDPVLTPHGFAPGQPGTSATEASVVHCCTLLDFRRRFPHLAPGLEAESGIGSGGVDRAAACVDLVVGVAVAGGGAYLTSVCLEGHVLVDLLREAGRPELAVALPPDHTPLPAALSRLAVVLEALLSGAGPAGP